VIRRLGRREGGLRRSLSSGRALRGPGGLQSALRATATSRRWMRWRRWRRRDEDTVIARPDDGLREISQILFQSLLDCFVAGAPCNDGTEANVRDTLRQVICPTGKKTPHAKSCPPLRAKIFRFAFDPNQTYSFPRPGPQEGRIAIVTDVGHGMRWTRERRETSAAHADGEVVWS
jgi:hypothetical protein